MHLSKKKATNPLLLNFLRICKDFSTNYFVQDFDRIVPGMSVYEVVELIGMPIGSSTSGMRSLDFSSNDSSIYRVLWDDEMKVVECYKVKS